MEPFHPVQAPFVVQAAPQVDSPAPPAAPEAAPQVDPPQEVAPEAPQEHVPVPSPIVVAAPPETSPPAPETVAAAPPPPPPPTSPVVFATTTPVPEQQVHSPGAPTAEENEKKRPLPEGDDDNGEEGGGDEYQQLKRRRKIEPRGVPWFVMLERLKQYRDRYGSLNVPSTFRQDPKLASWVQYQRYLFHHKDIAEERKAALDALGFEWSVLKPKSGGKKASWDDQLARVAAYKEANGSTLIPYSYPPDPSLGYWVSKQRKDYKHGQLSEEKIAKLNAIGFEWKPPTGRRQGSKKKVDEGDPAGGGNRQSTWEKMFDKLKQFQALHGSEVAHSRSGLSAIDKTLATWIKTQRHMYTIKKISTERVQKLESIGFAWRVGQDWKDYFARLKDHKERYGTCELPAGQDARLAAWIDSQRVSYKYRELPKERVDLLKSIGFNFAIDEGLKALESSAPPVDMDESQGGTPPALLQPKEESKPAAIGTLLAQASTEVGAATAPPTQPVTPKGEPTSKVSEYNVAIQLAGLADAKKAAKEEGNEAVANDKAADNDTKQPGEEATGPVVVDGANNAGEQSPGDKGTQDMDFEEKAKSPGAAGQAKALNGNKSAQTAEAPKKSEEEEALEIQAEIVELQSDKVRLQEEKVNAQQEKVALVREIKELEARNKDLNQQVKDQEAEMAGAETEEESTEKKELEEKVRQNEGLLSEQATQIKDQEERLRGLQSDLAALSTE